MRPITILLLLVALASCTSARRQLERAAAYEQAGMLGQAFEAYEHLYEQRPRTVEAHVGMKRTAQGLFDRLQAEASARYLAHDLAGGEQKRNEAIGYKNRMDRMGLDLQWDPLLDARRSEAQVHESRVLFEQAQNAFRTDRFEEAEDLATRCTKLDPANKEAEYLLKLAQLEPRYREGLRAMEMGLWREGFKRFKWVTDRDATYKDAWAMQTQCREHASYTLAYVPLYNRAMYTGELGEVLGQSPVEAQLAATIKQALLDLRDPFLVMVDRDNTEALLAEQRRQMSGVYDDRYSAEAGRMLGARYVLTGKLLRFDDVLFKQCEVQMQLIDTETGRIHASEVIKVNKLEIAKGAPRSQLLEKASQRIAARVAEFDPHKR